jgi:hypothetical protein
MQLDAPVHAATGIPDGSSTTEPPTTAVRPQKTARPNASPYVVLLTPLPSLPVIP